MCQSYVRLPRLFTSLAVAGMLGMGAHTAFARSAEPSCSPRSAALHDPSCSGGPAGDAYCDRECKRNHDPDPRVSASDPRRVLEAAASA
jgi:hypothetical protein